ncbi:MAG: immunoglobulin domain-containing protein [Verrucomicrobia bacterium]|nr:immunoglobulin domain-containing protein [Verrucomicrobiota bacterium]
MKRRIALLATCGLAGLAVLGLILRSDLRTESASVTAPAVTAIPPPSQPSFAVERRAASAPVSAPTNALFRTASQHWRQPIAEEAFAVFHDWTERYRVASAVERAGMVTEGVALAGARRVALKALIQTNPERALELTVPQAVRRALPAEVAALLEERMSGQGRLAVLGALAEPGREGDVVPTFRKAELAGREFDAFVYGRRLGEPTRAGIPLNGIAVDNFFAVNENPLRILEPEEADGVRANSGEALCSVSSRPAAVNQQPVVADVGGQTLFFCQPQHAIEENERIVAAEGGPPTGESNDPEATAWTEGQKKLLIIRVDFPDLVGVNLTDSGAVSLINNLNTFYTEMSYGRAGFISNSLGSDFTPVFRMPQPSAYYGTNNYYNQLRTAARSAAVTAGYVLGNYDLDVICFGAVPGWSWAGLGYVGAAGTWLRNNFSTGVAGHELGHNYGLNHASSWDTGGASVIGSGTSTEYGDSFDTMGAASAGNNHFNARYKNYLNWLTASEVITATSNGTYRIYAHDNPSSTGLRGLKIVKNSSTNYWVEFRQKFTSNKWLMSGGGLRWAQNGNQKSQLLDTTPGTTDGKTDSPIVIGRTFSDKVSNIHLTPIGKGGTTPESLDLVVNLGAFPENQVPTVNLAASETNVGTGVTLTFSALAADGDGDALAYFWSFGDGNFGTNGPGAAKSWAAAGEYVVRCEVSDMKGGVGSQSVIVRVGSPTTYRIAGQVQTSSGPLPGVRVSVSSTRMAWTDSDGTYTITGLPAGSYTVSASLEGYSFTGSDFTNPVSVGPNAAGINFNAYSSGITPPGIATQPLSQTVSLGDDVSFNVAATGTAPLAYQWRFNGANIPGATANSYARSNLQATNAGNYSVVVSNAAGTVASANAVLTVNAPPFITAQPQSQTVIAGNTARFSVEAAGSSPLAYQWQLRGTNLPGANKRTHLITSAQPGQAGDYQVVVTNSLGTVTSAPAQLRLRLRPLLSWSLAATNGQPQMTLTGTPGDYYVIEASTNLLDWNPVLTVTNLSGAVLYSDPGLLREAQKFFRAWLVP